jgi:hypothetical protein
MKQLNIITASRPGVLDDILQRLAAENINVETVDVECINGSGIVAITVDRYDDALRLLTYAGYQAVAEDVLLLQLQDRPGALGQVSLRLKDARIDIRSLRILARDNGRSTVGLVTDNNTRARAVLAEIMAA